MRKFLLIVSTIIGVTTSLFAQFDSTFIVRPTSSSSMRVIQCGDIDSDGDVDVLAKQESGHDVFWYGNDGAGNFSEGVFIYDLYYLGNTAVHHDFFAEIVDIDKSGKNDLVCFSNGANKPFVILDNDFTSIIDLIDNPGLFEVGDMKLGDLDKDNDLDMILFSKYENIYWLENTGKIQGWISHEIPNTENTATGEVIDLNGDGFLDLLKTSYSGFGHDIFLNDKSASFVKTTIEDDRFSYAVSIKAFDVDNDGDLDVVGSNDEDEGNIVIFKNNEGNYSRELINESLYRFESLAYEDFDLDGDIDVVGGCWMFEGVGNGCYLTSYQNQNGIFTKETLLKASGIMQRSLKVADINGDDKPDLVFSSAAKHAIYWLRNSTTITGFEEDLTKKISIHPNPVNRNLILINFLNLGGELDLQLYDQNGRKYLSTSIHISQTSSEYALDLSTLHNGIYHVHLTDGKHKVVKKVIVSR